MFKKKPQALGALLDDFVENYHDRKALKRGMILSLWPEIVGKNISEQTENLHFKNDKLFLNVKNQAWRHEIHMQRFVIAKKLNQRVKEEIIKEIIVKA